MKLLKQLKLKNFLSHENTVIDFNDIEKKLIDGKSGCGKSSIFDAITWSLFGESRSENKNLIRKGCNKAEVSITVVDNELNKEYEITRSINDKNKHEISIKEKTEGQKKCPVAVQGIRENQNFIEKNIIGSSYSLFVNSCCHPQDSVNNFCNQSASGRKDILLEIINASQYDEYLKITKEQLSDSKNKTEILESKITEKKIFIDENSIQIIGIENIKEKLNELKNKYLESENNYNLLLAKKDSLISSLSEIKLYSESQSSIKNLILSQEEDLKKTNKAIIELEMVDIKLLEEDVKKILELKSILISEENKRELSFKYNNDLSLINSSIPVYRDFDIEILKINKQIKEWNDQEIITCQKCGTPYPQFQERKDNNLKKLNEELEHLVSQQNFYNEQRRLISEKIEKLGKKPEYDLDLIKKLNIEIEKLSLSEKKLNEITNNKSILISKYSEDIEKISKNIEENKTSLEEINIKLESKGTLEGELVEIQNKVYNINKEKSLLNSEISDIQAKILYLENLTIQISKAKEEVLLLIDEKNRLKERAELLELMKNTFGQNGIKAIVIDIIVPQLEEKINAILSKLSNFKISIETQKNSLSGENLLEGLFVNVINDQGESMDYNSYSGGEKNKISSAIFEGLAQIKGNIGFRMLDESVVGLDNESEEKFSEVILNLKENVQQLFVISHLQSIKDIFEEKINVIKLNGVSQII